MNGLRTCSFLSAFFVLVSSTAFAETGWQSPAEDILSVLYASQLPWVWTSPDGEYMLLADPVIYPDLEELASPMHKLAGTRVDPVLNYYHGRHGGTDPRLVSVSDGTVTSLELPHGAEVHGITFTVDCERFAMPVSHDDHFSVWTGDVNGEVHELANISLNPLAGRAIQWLPDQERLLVMAIPPRGPVPEPPVIPGGPEVMEGLGASARSTYEARDLLETAYDDVLFSYFFQSVPLLVNPSTGDTEQLADPNCYYSIEYSPDGEYALAEYLVEPWSHEVAWWRFAKEIEVWDSAGEYLATVASLPLEDAVPVHGVPEGPRSVVWRETAPHQLFWVEALDGGDPASEASHRDRLMRLDAPFTGAAEEVFRAEHRIYPWSMAWGENGGTLMLTERERMRRWLYTWLLDVDSGTARLWFERNEADYYGDPGRPVMRQAQNGSRVMRETEDGVYFAGSGATEEGDRPFLDIRNLETGEVERVFRSPADRYEAFVGFASGGESFIIRSESASDVPNYYLSTPLEVVQAEEGEAERTHNREQITFFQDPTPELRGITRQIVHYEREDGIPLSFYLYLPPDHREGTPLPTVLSAYPLEYSGGETAGQVRGSASRFLRFYGSSHMFFLLRGYAVMDWVAMPVIGDPETAYDTFTEQLVASAEAAVNKAVEMGVADPERIGVIGHSHGALMVANLLAHSDLFSAGIARSGSYNKTNQPFGFQRERRSMFDALDTYIQVSPLFFADSIDEPLLLIHGNDDANPGTRTFQSEVLYEAVRGSGGNTRLILLPFEDHGYSARESIEHVLWEELRWFDMYVKGDGTR